MTRPASGPGRILLLNGSSSAGKSSIAKALQEIAAEPWLHVAMDDFLDMLPAACWGHAQGVVFEPVEEAGAAALAVRSGPVAERALTGMREAVAALARAGNDLIVDEVLLGGAAADYRARLAGLEVRWIGVFAPLAVLEARERARGDRRLGLARWQHERVHEGVDYDLTVGSAAATPLDCARLIKERFGL
ncbi:chloramphenicol 3-O phosphotransferase [Tistlia consotensis]|uniref:Chloramphenicol 3-O phosphotransferase n=1 Tax=Tistlia consotensis USBA 355 TaxID=560819 RepID=A0A1Y6CDW9_9PROT|nr:AAA family ATPase [Tistlia consotensis]SMF58722.1 chloramphenicol 3-O phosphotransferase [Tistlia consotensis USBA 355]SNR63718.1 chloramphenicol 3-O phosphotransferase [Tistlia consotensis]